jgi:hypothetical protein
LPGPDQVSQYLRLTPSGKGQPLLVDLVTSMKNPSASHTSPSLSPHASYPQSPRSDPPASPRSPRAQPTHWPTKTTPHAPSAPVPTNSPTIKKLTIPTLSVPVQPSPTQLPPTKPQPLQPQSQPQLNSHSIPQPQSLPQPQPQPQKPQPTPATVQKPDLKVNDLKAQHDLKANDDGKKKKNDPKNKEAAYLSYPEGEDDIDEEIDEDLYDLDGDLDFEDDEDIEIDATPPKPESKTSIVGKDDFGKSPQPIASKVPLGSLNKPAATVQAKSTQPKPPQKDQFEIEDDDDPGSLEEDMKRLSVIEQKLNLFTSQPTSSNNLFTSHSTARSSSKPNIESASDDDLNSIGSDYSNEVCP